MFFRKKLTDEEKSKIIAEKLNKEGFEFFLNDNDRYNAYICNSSFDLFFGEYLNKTFEKCVIQEEPKKQIVIKYQDKNIKPK